jgi:hypothetical protein
MQSKFPFGYLFIKSSKVLALLIFLTGMFFTGLIIYQWKAQLSEVKYKNNSEFIVSLQELQKDYTFTKTKVLHLHSQLMVEDEADVELFLDPNIYKSYSSDAHFEDLLKQLANLKKNSAIFKKLIFQNFSASSEYLLEKMRAHALNKKWISDIPEELAEGTSENDAPQDFSLISLGADDFEKKRDVLMESLRYLQKIRQSVENPDSQQKVDSLINHLTQYQNAMRKVAVDLVLEEKTTEDDKSKRKRIFVIMDELDLMKKNIQEIATSNWTLDKQYSLSVKLLDREYEKCKLASRSSAQMTTLNVTKLTIIIGLTLFLAVLSVVAGDLLRATFMIALKE